MEGEGPWRILEFYCGIGGMRYSLMRAGIGGEVLEAFDINDVANDVYQHNFGHRPFQGNIQSLTSVELDKYRAHIWLMSPPCQPYTRQGLQKDTADARASSFIKIFELIPHMLKPPLMLFVENVVGFEVRMKILAQETSDTHEQLMEILSKTNFATQEFILSPLQFGVPYSRPRYFCLAKRKPTSFKNPSFNNQLLWTPMPLLRHMNDHCNPNGGWEASEVPCEPIKNFLQTKNFLSDQREIAKSHFSFEPDASPLSEDTIDDSSTTNSVHDEREDIAMKVGKNAFRAEENGDDISSLDKYIVPWNLIERWGSAMDIVFPDSKRCCCFTKSYYRYVKGTGSFLATVQAGSAFFHPTPEEKPEVSSLKELGLRYFTPQEVANLHSFPDDFNFPHHISLRQRYALLGNSLSVAVVAPLLKYLFAEPT